MQLSGLEQSVVGAFALRPALASALFSAWALLPDGAARSVRSLVDAAQLGVTEESAAEEVLSQAACLGLLQMMRDGYSPSPGMHQHFARLGFALSVLDYYTRQVHKDATTAQVVLTKPPQPSELEKKLDELGWRTAALEQTQHAFRAMARQTQKRFVVVTPFFDAAGADWLRELFSAVGHGIERVLVLRSLEDRGKQDYPVGFDALASWLKTEQIQVLNYSIQKPGGGRRETFHAKIVLCDRSAAYLGSSNMTAASLEYSMEMGVILNGAAAGTVAEVVDAVLGAAQRVC